MLSHTGLKAGLAERFRAIVNIFMQNGGEIARELIETRCQRGADIARQMRFSEAVARRHPESRRALGRRRPAAEACIGDAIPLYARIALLAQVVDVFQIANGGDAAALAEIAARVRQLVRSGPRRGLRAGRRATPISGTCCARRHLQQAIFALEPAQQSALVDDDYLDDIAAAFAQVVDSKSPYTAATASASRCSPT